LLKLSDPHGIYRNARQFGESGQPYELLEKYGMTAKYIADASLKVLRRKSQNRYFYGIGKFRKLFV